MLVLLGSKEGVRHAKWREKDVTSIFLCFCLKIQLLTRVAVVVLHHTRASSYLRLLTIFGCFIACFSSYINMISSTNLLRLFTLVGVLLLHGCLCAQQQTQTTNNIQKARWKVPTDDARTLARELKVIGFPLMIACHSSNNYLRILLQTGP